MHTLLTTPNMLGSSEPCAWDLSVAFRCSVHCAHCSSTCGCLVFCSYYADEPEAPVVLSHSVITHDKLTTTASPGRHSLLIRLLLYCTHSAAQFCAMARTTFVLALLIPFRPLLHIRHHSVL